MEVAVVVLVGGWVLAGCRAPEHLLSTSGSTRPEPGSTTTPFPTGETGMPVGSVPQGPPLPRPVPAVAPCGSYGFDTVPWSPSVTGVAIADDGGVCVAGSSWYEGYGSGTIVDQYAPGDARMERIAPGCTRDTAFAGSGTFVLGRSYGSTAVAAAPDAGCYLAVGLGDGYTLPKAGLVRVDSGGSLDPTFDPAVLDHDPGASEGVTSLAALADGGVLALITDGSGVYVDRFDADGRLDPGWGSGGEAVVATDAAIPQAFGSLVVQSDGSVLVGFGRPASVAKLDSTGALDPSYGSDGIAASTGAFPVWAMAAGADGHVVLAGDEGVGHANLPAVEGLDPSGQPSLAPMTASVGGSRSYDEVRGVAVDDQDRIVLAGRVDAPAVIRLDSTGALDTAFGTGGVLIYPPEDPGAGAEFDGLELAGDGTIVVAGGRGQQVLGMVVGP